MLWRLSSQERKFADSGLTAGGAPGIQKQFVCTFGMETGLTGMNYSLATCGGVCGKVVVELKELGRLLGFVAESMFSIVEFEWFESHLEFRQWCLLCPASCVGGSLVPWDMA